MKTWKLLCCWPWCPACGAGCELAHRRVPERPCLPVYTGILYPGACSHRVLPLAGASVRPLERSYPACLLLTQWPSLVSFALYVWQFHFVSSEARSFLLAGLGSTPASAVFPGLPAGDPLFQSQLGAAGNLGGQCALPADAGGAVLPGLPMGPAEAVTRPPLLKMPQPGPSGPGRFFNACTRSAY